MSCLTICDLPTEVIESFILPFLSYDDVQNFGRVGNRRLEEIAATYSIDNKSKFSLSFITITYWSEPLLPLDYTYFTFFISQN